MLEDLQHILAVCSSLEPARLRLSNYTHKICDQFPEIKNIIQQYCTRTNPLFVQFLLDCSVLPLVILAKHEYGLAFLGSLYKISHIGTALSEKPQGDSWSCDDKEVLFVKPWSHGDEEILFVNSWSLGDAEIPPLPPPPGDFLVVSW